MRKSIQRCFYMLAVLSILFGIASPGVMAEEASANSDFIYKGIGSDVYITGYRGNGGEVVIPETLSASKVVSIGKAAFSHWDEITSIVIPGGVTYIGEEAFFHCNGLTNIEIPDSVTFIDECAFEYCDKLTSITLPKGITSINSYTFTKCSGLTSITIPDGVTSIGWAAFSYCTGLTSIVIPDSVTSISGLAFKDHNESLVIYGVEGSYAETYAREQGIRFLIDESLNKKIPIISYQTHVQNIGWQEDVLQGGMSGTEGMGYRLESIRISFEDDANYDLGVAYSTHVENIGWQAEVANGATAGTTDHGLRLEAIKIRLTGADSDKFDIYYQVHAQNFGWLDWAKNGDSAGTAGFGYRLEAIRISIVPKGDPAPGATSRPFVQKQ